MSNYRVWRRFAATCLLALGVSLAGAPALATPTTPTSDFTDNGDGTATHKTTGLTWKRCAEGMTWTGSTCTGTASTNTYDQAKALTSSFAGKSDWRLPTIAELVTLVERENVSPAINASIFPGTPSEWFWSASVYASSSDKAWNVNFSSGYDYPTSKANIGTVRMVRGGQLLGSYGFYTPTSDFTDNGDGTVTHNRTSLTWKRCAEGQTWNTSGCLGTASTQTWAQATAMTSSYGGKSDWRLPTQNELLTLIEWSKYFPAINSTMFPDTPSEWFWSASLSATSSVSAWAVFFGVGNDSPTSKVLAYPVRLVRGTQSVGTTSTSANLIVLSVSCPFTISASTTGTCTATATYSDGSSKAASPVWISSNTSALTVSGGTLTAGTVTTDTPVTVTASYTEGSVSKTATTTVTVKAAAAKLSGLTISGDASVKSSSSITLTATGSYSDGTSHSISPTWSVSDSSVATISNGVLTAKTVTTDTPLAVTASHTENGVTQTATWMVSVKAAAATVTSLLISGSPSVNAGATTSYTASAVYSDGTTKAASNVTWAVSGSGATVDAAGNLTAANVTTDTSVTLTAIYTDNGGSKTATLTVAIKAATTAASACSGAASNLSAITVAGKAIKSPGDSLDVSYCLKNFNSATKFDIYVAVMLPDGSFLFMQSAGFFGTPSFVPYDGKKAPVAYLSNTLIPDKSGSVLNISVLPMELPTGTYTFYAIPVFAGKDVMNGFNWVGTLASAKLNFNR